MKEPRQNHYEINIPPQPWQRARLCGKYFFDNQAREKLAVGITLRSQHKGQPFTTPIHVDITFFMRIPQSKIKRKDVFWHYSVPDLDNLIKFLLDAAKGAIYKDDRLISSLTAKKIYDKQPRVILDVREIK